MGQSAAIVFPEFRVELLIDNTFSWAGEALDNRCVCYERRERNSSRKIKTKKGRLPCSHSEYLHDERGTRELTKREKKMVDRVIKIWENKSKQ
ncbi:MAG: hypothetical protein HXK87_09570 [Lachnospiraceae bacterium]|nr:hypothetical protein [Lachnospiraceae bacterium]